MLDLVSVILHILLYFSIMVYLPLSEINRYKLRKEIAELKACLS